MNFSLQYADNRRVTQGWLPLSSSVTDENGSAKSSIAFGLPDGNYSIKAYHTENENFGESENVTDVEVVLNMTEGGFLFEPGGESRFSPMSDEWDLNVAVIPANGVYAELPLITDAEFISTENLGSVFMAFSAGGNASSGAWVSPCEIAGEFWYLEAFTWEPTILGSFAINVTVYAIGIGQIASEVVGVTVSPCPSSFIINSPLAVYGDEIPITAVFAMPRQYQVASTGFCTATTQHP